MEIKKVNLAEITPYYNNPRENANAVPPVMESIKRFTFIKPILVDKEGVIIAGHTRYIAAFQLGMTEVPVIYSDMDEEQAKLFRIIDNKIAEKSSFDEHKLVEDLKKLKVPTDMQAFFFESIEDMMNFNASDFVAPSADDTLNELDNAFAYESGSEGSESGTEAVVFDVVDSGEGEDDNLPDSNVMTEEKDDIYGDLYKIREENGKRYMKVICPYCGNIEEVEVIEEEA